MSTKVALINSSLAEYTAEEFSFFQKFLLNAGVLASPTGTLGLGVTDNSPDAMNVLVAAGDALVQITKGGVTWKVHFSNDAQVTLAVPTQSSGANRVGAVIVRIDVDAEPNLLKTNIGTIEYIPGTSTSALSDAAIQAAVGSDGFLRLANVTVPTGASAIAAGNVADARKRVVHNFGAVSGAGVYGVSATGTDSYAITTDYGFTSIPDGQLVTVKVDVASAGGSALSVDGLNYPLKKLHDEDTLTGDIEAGQIFSARFNSTTSVWEIQSQVALGGVTAEMVSFFTDTDITGAEAERLRSGLRSFLKVGLKAAGVFGEDVIPSAGYDHDEISVAFSPDGADMYVATNGVAVGTVKVFRYTRDAKTGVYLPAQAVLTDTTNWRANAIKPGLVVGATYVYLVGQNTANNNINVRRYARNLTGGTTMTVSGTAFTGGSAKCAGDDTNIWVMTGGGSTVLAKYAVSGTTATRGTNIALGAVTGDNFRGFAFDGTDLLVLNGTSGANAAERYNQSGVLQASVPTPVGGASTDLAVTGATGFPCGVGIAYSGVLYAAAIKAYSNAGTAVADCWEMELYAVSKP